MNKTVLVLEDDSVLREVLVEALEDDYKVYGAGLPSEAIALARQVRFDLVVTDVRMDEMDGIECLEQLRVIQPHVKAIVITGYASEEAPIRAIAVDVQDYLHKPIPLGTFMSATERALQEDETAVEALNRGVQKMAEAAQTALAQAELIQLQAARSTAFRSFYVAVRSDLLGMAAAWRLWSRLEQLESARETSMSRALLDGYRSVPALAGQLRRSDTILEPATPDPEEVSLAEFAGLYRRVKEGEVSSDLLMLAPTVRRLPQDHPQLYAKTWGALPTSA